MGFDTYVFRFINQGCANPFLDALLPVMTLDLVNMAVLLYSLFVVLVRAAQQGGRERIRRAQRTVLAAGLAVGLGELIASH